MAKKIILALIMLILIVLLAMNFTLGNTIDLYIDGENVTVEAHGMNLNTDYENMNMEICNYAGEVMNDTTSNITTLKTGINEICNRYNFKNPRINVDSSIGPDQIPVVAHVDGTSMLPTLQDGQEVLFNKSHDVHVGDIVVAESDEYGGIVKRVGAINDKQIFLESDNKEVTYEIIDGSLYEVKGITTWVDISDINGVVIAY